MVLSELEKRQIEKNEERLWDLAALTAAPSLFQSLMQADNSEVLGGQSVGAWVAKQSYDLADALIRERRKRLTDVSSV